MKVKIKRADNGPACKTNPCKECRFCQKRARVVKTDIKALYDAEVLAYSFYFYQQLLTINK